HRLAYAHGRRQMEDHVNAFQRPVYSIRIAHIALDQLRFSREITGKLIAVDLRRQVVKDANVVSGGDQGIRQMRSHESGSARDQNILGHPYLAPIRISLAFTFLLASFAGAYFRTVHAAKSAKSVACRGGLV